MIDNVDVIDDLIMIDKYINEIDNLIIKFDMKGYDIIDYDNIVKINYYNLSGEDYYTVGYNPVNNSTICSRNSLTISHITGDDNICTILFINYNEKSNCHLFYGDASVYYKNIGDKETQLKYYDNGNDLTEIITKRKNRFKILEKLREDGL